MNNSPIRVGFDGGGTRSRLVVRTIDGTVSKQEFGLSIKYTDVGVAESVRRFTKMLQSLAPIENWKEAQIALSLSGASDEVKNKEWKKSLAATYPEKNISCYIEGDASCSLAAAYPNTESGYLLIAGTGSVAIGRDRNGKLYKTGGLGRLLGDEGSGYWIGLQALKWFVDLEDSAGSRVGGCGLRVGKLGEAINTFLQPETGGEFSVLREKLYSNEISPARLAPLVFQCSDDPIALDILEQGATALARLITSVKAKADGNIEPIITLHGSLCLQPVYSELISEALEDKYEIRILDEWAVAEHCLNLDVMR